MEFDLRLIDVDLHHKAVQSTGFQALGCRRATFEYSMNTIILELQYFLYKLYIQDSRPEFGVPPPVTQGQCALRAHWRLWLR